MLRGYARVSTLDQDTALQSDALVRAGVLEVHTEKGSSVGPRPVLHQLLDSVQAGDVLVVWKLDRIARSLPDLLSILGRLKKANVGLRSLTEPIDTSTPIGEFMLQILGAVAQLERSMIRERTVAGQVAAIKRGAKFGRPKALDPDREAELLRRRLAGEPRTPLAAEFGVSKEVVRRLEREAEGVFGVGAYPVLGKYIDSLPVSC